MRVARRFAVWAAVLALYVYGVVLSSPSPSSGAIVFAISLWPVLVSQLSRPSYRAALAAMAVPLWVLAAIYLFTAAVGHPAPGSLPEVAASGHVLFSTSTAFFPGGLLAGFALKRLDVPKELQRDYALELFLLSPWIAFYIAMVIGRLFLSAAN